MAIPVEYSDFSKPLVLSSGDPIFTINLAGNATTGYVWVLEGPYNQDFIRPINYHYQAPKKKIIGAGGVFQFTFHAMPKAFAVPTLLEPLRFIYLRPWDMQQSKTQEVRIITVAD